MAFIKLERHLAEQERGRAALRAERAEKEGRKALKEAVRDVLPKHMQMPRRKAGRAPTGGVSRKEVMGLRARAKAFLDGEGGLKEFETEAQHTALVILLIDGVLGTEPWRAAGSAHGGLIAANARLRYLENASRLLSDLRGSREAGSGHALTEGVIDAETT